MYIHIYTHICICIPIHSTYHRSVTQINLHSFNTYSCRPHTTRHIITHHTLNTHLHSHTLLQTLQIQTTLPLILPPPNPIYTLTPTSHYTVFSHTHTHLTHIHSRIHTTIISIPTQPHTPTYSYITITLLSHSTHHSHSLTPLATC